MLETPGRRDIVRSISLQGFATSEPNGVHLIASYKSTNVHAQVGSDGCMKVKVSNGFEATPGGIDLSYLSVVRARPNPRVASCLARPLCLSCLLVANALPAA